MARTIIDKVVAKHSYAAVDEQELSFEAGDIVPGYKKNRNNNKKSSFKKKTIEDCVFHVGSNKQASDYEVTIEFVLNHVKIFLLGSHFVLVPGWSHFLSHLGGAHFPCAT